MLTFNTVLETLGIDPAGTLLVRQTPKEAALRRVLPWIALERSNLYLAYHQVQWPAAERAQAKAERLISFIGHESGKGVLAGAYSVGPSSSLRSADYWDIPEHRALAAHGMAGPDGGRSEMLRFELTTLVALDDYIGRITVDWPPPAQSWFRWAHRQQLPLAALHPETTLTPPMPAWNEIVLPHSDLQLLPATWAAALAQWRGVYLVFDTERQKGYVGAAYGPENILGRWLDYADTGHGGNALLTASQTSSLRFSILQRTSPDMPPDEVQRLEASWKRRLHTREHGLNAN